MKLDFTKTFKTRKGEIVKLTEKSEAMTGEDACLLSLEEIQQGVDQSEKYQRYEIEKKIVSGETDFKSEEIVLLKKAIGGFPFTPWVHGCICDWLDQKDEPTKLEVVK